MDSHNVAVILIPFTPSYFPRNGYNADAILTQYTSSDFPRSGYIFVEQTR
jgi:hypothetical protein